MCRVPAQIVRWGEGVQEGKNIGKILNEAEKFWVNNNFNLSPDDFEKIIKKNTISN